MKKTIAFQRFKVFWVNLMNSLPILALGQILALEQLLYPKVQLHTICIVVLFCFIILWIITFWTILSNGSQIENRTINGMRPFLYRKYNILVMEISSVQKCWWCVYFFSPILSAAVDTIKLCITYCLII